jgi:Asp-tRNA(Asn)/Glu-tRNA(Gln) amidotransferase C subunit
MKNCEISAEKLKNLYKLSCLKQDKNEQNIESLQNIVNLFKIIKDVNLNQQNNSNIDITKSLNELRSDTAIKVEPFLNDICSTFNTETQRIKVPQVVEK